MHSSAHALRYRISLLRLLIGLGAFIFSALFLQPLVPLAAHASAPKQANFTVQYLDSSTHQYVAKGLKLNAAAGTTLQVSISVLNSGNIAGTASIYAADALTGQNGGIAYQAHASPRRIVGSWITLPLNKVTLAAQEKKLLTIQIAIPNGIRPGVYSGGVVAEDASNQTFSRTGKNSKFSFTILRRSVLPIRVTVPGMQVENLLDMSIRFDDSSGLQTVVLSLNNLSTAIIDAKGTLLIADLKGHRLQLLSVQITDFLPQTGIRYPVYLRGTALKAGTYRATLDLKYGHNHPLHMLSNITVAAKTTKKNSNTLAAFLGPDQGSSNTSGSSIPLWQMAGLGALLLIGAGTILFWLYKFSLILKRRSHQSP